MVCIYVFILLFTLIIHSPFPDFVKKLEAFLFYLIFSRHYLNSVDSGFISSHFLSEPLEVGIEYLEKHPLLIFNAFICDPINL